MPAAMPSPTPPSDYTADSVRAVDDRWHARHRPGMYIGSADSAGVAHLFNEVLDNAIDEATAGHCTLVAVTVEPDQTVVVADNGRGMPLGEKSFTPIPGGPTVTLPTPQLLLSVARSGGKFGAERGAAGGAAGGGGYQTSAGLNGIGVKAVAFCSRRLVVDIVRDGQHYQVIII